MTDQAPHPIEGDPSDDQDAITARARAGIEQARKTAGKALKATRRKGEEVIDDTREKTYRAAAETNRLFQEHPVAAVAAAAAAGAILGIFLPRFAIANQAGKLAGRAMKAAAASEAAQMVWSGLKDGRNTAVKGAAGKAASAVGGRIVSHRAQLGKPLEVQEPAQVDTDEPDSTSKA